MPGQFLNWFGLKEGFTTVMPTAVKYFFFLGGQFGSDKWGLLTGRSERLPDHHWKIGKPVFNFGFTIWDNKNPNMNSRESKGTTPMPPLNKALFLGGGGIVGGWAP